MSGAKPASAGDIVCHSDDPRARRFRRHQRGSRADQKRAAIDRDHRVNLLSGTPATHRGEPLQSPKRAT